MTARSYNIQTSPPNRKELAEAFGMNQSAVRRLETITLDVTKNLPQGIDNNTAAIQFVSMGANAQVTPPQSAAPFALLSMGANSSVSVPQNPALSAFLSMGANAQAPAQGIPAGLLAMLAAQSSVPVPATSAQGGVLARLEIASNIGQAPGNYLKQQPLVAFQQASTTGTSLTSGTAANVASIQLAAGTWDLSGSIVFNAAATTVVQQIAGGVSTSSGALGTPDTQTKFQEAITGGSYDVPVPLTRIVLASAATVYLVAQATFTTSTMTADGYIKARPGL
ncbi:MAG: hypothetical protein EPN70_03525 [Paraburkholderia sp.]|uniref:hypothetical protein n=1 Tax=Paraburkholderia sp. TaxID=1926495 RepID=UPI00121AC9BA|nr:hypothetical protein [Paraburkholderia sp.]TAM07255.1 MAG: hypothetical protein EPN70_03525 [Paraburkholderia sp.]TAM32606.1 MAG: hypothetical protein EPN59_01535 [Paraburkholderia sp.]